MASRQEMLAWCDEMLQVGLYKDYAPNGLQVEGTSQIDKMVVAVTASRAAIEFAAANLSLIHI